MSVRDEVAREIAALYGFIESIVIACSQPPRSAAYTDSSEHFFQYVTSFAKHTLEYLSSYPVELEGSDSDFQGSRRELSEIRRAWRELHRFIKPATDADTLNQPTALVDALLQRVKQLPGFDNEEYAIFHTDEFNYLQVNPVLMDRAVATLASVIGAEGLSKPNLIGIPNSQGNALFLNCLVAHEIGHFVFGKKSVRSSLIPEIETALTAVIGEAFKAKELTYRSNLIDLVAQWSEELFCDLFAVYLIGPAYSFAYIELFDVSALLDRRNAIGQGELRRFYPLYPSDHFRVKQQAELLKRLDWWGHVSVIQSRCTRTLEALLAVSDKDFKALEKDERKPLVEAFIMVLPEISSHLGKIAGTLDTGVHQFAELWKTIADYLDQGVVPSSINVKTGPERYETAIPSALTLVNASFRYYLERIENLMSSIKDQDLTVPEQRVYWINKLQSWTAKALEDVSLYEKTKHGSHL